MAAAEREIKHPKHKQSRDRLREEQRCINGPRAGAVSRSGLEHGPVVKAGKCQRCIDVWEKSR